jgi:hypothetical protein
METDDELWQRHIQINQYGCFLGMKAAVPAMERSGGGSIVNISSVAGLKGSPGSFAYAATKWALRGMTKSAAIDLSGRKIRVNSVHPGPIDTDMIAFRTPEEREERMKQVPMHRYGTPEEVAQLVAPRDHKGVGNPHLVSNFVHEHGIEVALGDIGSQIGRKSRQAGGEVGEWGNHTRGILAPAAHAVAGANWPALRRKPFRMWSLGIAA